MTLTDKIKMVDDLIKENRDATIRDYLELLREMREIEMQRFCHTHIRKEKKYVA
jgi:hypothetical protein